MPRPAPVTPNGRSAPAVGQATWTPPPIQRVRGTTDLLPEEFSRLEELRTRIQAGFEAYGYRGVQPPIIEPLDLFLRKSGDEIVARMYAFSHWNRRLCLRPEHTASVMRLFVEEMQARTLPLRLQYAGPEFRYERPSRGRQRQYTVVGVELIGAQGPAADAEALHLACEGLRLAGVGAYRLVVGHLGVVLQMLRQLGIGEHAQELILDQMEPLTRGRVTPDEAVERVMGLLGGPTKSVEGSEAGDSTALATLPPDQAAAVAAELMQRVSLPLEGGTRTPQEIVRRLLARANRLDQTEQVRRAVDFVMSLHAAAGSARQLAEVRRVVEEQGLDTGPLDEVETALRLLAAHGSRPADGATEWEVDLSLARGLRYYTGLVFEVYVEDRDGPLQVCGGGRYDDLIRALGGREPTPACGFAFGLERLALALGSGGSSPSALPRVLVVPVTDDDYAASLAAARLLRESGALVVEQELRARGVKAALRHADRAGVAAVVMIGAQERADEAASVRVMATREERRVPLATLPELLKQVLA